LFYSINCTLKWFALAVAAISAELTAILRNKTCKTLQFLRCLVNTAHNGKFCTCWPNKFCVHRTAEFWHPHL